MELPKPPKLPGGRRHDEVFNPKKLFVGGLSKETTQQQFKAYWQQWGELKDCVVMIDPKTQKSRGFGFVVFASQQIASDILSRSESLTMYGRKLDIKKAVPRSNYRASPTQGHTPITSDHYPPMHPVYDRYHPPYYPPNPMYPPQHATRSNPYPPYTMSPHHRVTSVPRIHRNYDRPRDNFRRTTNRKHDDKLFVGGLADTFTDRTLRSYFNKYGKVQDVVVMFDNEGNSRRFGFVTFVNRDNSDLVLSDGKHTINGVNVTVERAIPKNHQGGSTSPRRDRRSPVRDYDPYSYRYDDPYYNYAHPPPMYRHKGPPPPPIYSPPPSGHHPPPISPHALPHHPGYVPPYHSRPPYYPPPGATPSAAIASKPGAVAKSTSNTTAPVRYQYTYSTVTSDAAKQSVSEMKTTVSVESQDKKPMDSVQASIKQPYPAMKASHEAYAVPNNRTYSSTPVLGGGYYAQGYVKATATPRTNIQPPVHAPAAYGSYRTAYPNAAYGGSRGSVAATKAYHPY